jgi:hypothetical protein
LKKRKVKEDQIPVKPKSIFRPGEYYQREIEDLETQRRLDLEMGKNYKLPKSPGKLS